MLELDPARLLQYGLALSQVIEAINANNASGGGSVIDRGDVSYVVRGVGLLGSLDDMGNVVVKTTDSGTPVLVKDLGRLTDRKSTRLNSSHLVISYAVFCLKKKNKRL